MKTLMEIMTKVVAASANVENHKQNLLVRTQRALAGVLVLFLPDYFSKLLTIES